MKWHLRPRKLLKGIVREYHCYQHEYDAQERINEKVKVSVFIPFSFLIK